MATETRGETAHELLERVRGLSIQDQLWLLERVAALVRQSHGAPPPRPQRSLLELEGLGEHVWRDESGELMDAQEYVNRERASWRG